MAPSPDAFQGARRLIVGAAGPERAPLRKDPDEPRWFEPLHVRAPAAERGRMAASVAAGADLLLAPTWLTHRRALLPVGETRQARAWTSAAVRIAREAADAGLELRAAEAARAAEVAEARGEQGFPGAGLIRPAVLVAGVLPALDVAPEPGAGRLQPRDVASERDHRAQAGLLEEVGVDLVLTLGHATIASARTAVEAITETGMPAWVAVGVAGDRVPALLSGESVAAWAEAMVHAGAATLLIAPAAGVDVAAGVDIAAVLGEVRAAGVVAERVGILASVRGPADAARLPDDARRWIDAGAHHLGVASGVTPAVVTMLRDALDAADALEHAQRTAERGRLAGLVADAAARAPGGRAAWVGERRTEDPALPSGFAWLQVPSLDARSLPEGAFGLVVVPVGGDAHALAAILAPGGIMLVGDAPAEVIAALDTSGLRVVARSTESGGVASSIIVRRDP